MPFYAICPFFKYEKNDTIGCEMKKMIFPTKDDKKIWMENLCCKFDYKYCANAQQLLKQYEKNYKSDDQ